VAARGPGFLLDSLKLWAIRTRSTGKEL
jgi:hypothetical protein